jgi:(E)-benzylidenesuccinyl-CoA hydratase
MGSNVLYEVDGHVATITYNRPEALNAIDAAVRADLNRAFCVGADIRNVAGAAGDFAGTFWERPTVNSFESGWEIFKPVIAAVNGHGLGYGLTLVTWCDFVIASPPPGTAAPRPGPAPDRLAWPGRYPHDFPEG